MLELENVCAGYEEHLVLNDVCAKVEDGTLWMIIGPNGSGKSTLLKSMDGLLKETAGKVLLNGTDLLAQTPKERAKNCAYMPQNRNVPLITAERLVAHGRYPYLSYPRKLCTEDRNVIRKALEICDAGELARRNLQELSGGERQKVYLAMALAQDTPLILMDEPLSFLDIGHQLDLMETCRKLCAQGKTIVMVLHDIRLAMKYGDRISICCNGSLTSPEKTEVLLSSPLWKEVFGIRIERIELDGEEDYICRRYRP